MEFRAPVLLTVRKYDVQETLESDSPKGQALTHVWSFATSEPAAGDKNYFHKGRNVSHRNSSSCPPFKNISFFIHLFILGNLFTQVGFELRTLGSMVFRLIQPLAPLLLVKERKVPPCAGNELQPRTANGKPLQRNSRFFCLKQSTSVSSPNLVKSGPSLCLFGPACGSPLLACPLLCPNKFVFQLK